MSKGPVVWGLWLRWVTLGVVLAAFAVAYLGLFAADSITKGVYPQLIVATVIGLGGAVAIPLLLRPFPVRTLRVLPWVTGALSLAVVAYPMILWRLGATDLGYVTFQGLSIVTAPFGFGDLELTLLMPICAQQGYDIWALDATCTIVPSLYGPAGEWFKVLPLSLSMVPFVGAAMLVGSSLALVWLSKQSLGRGQLVLLVAAIGSGWMLLLERANLDTLIIWVAILLVWSTRRWKGLVPWILAAALIWLLGAWKYYPFAMGLALLPVLRIRRGWMVIAGFAVAVVGFFIAYQELALLSVRANAGMSAASMGGFGRNSLATLLGGFETIQIGWTWADILIAVIALLTAMWGFAVMASVRRPLVNESMLAICGGSTAAVAMIASGFGYSYKMAPLLLAVPMLSKLGGRRRPQAWRDSTIMLIMVGIGITATWSLPTMSTVAVLASAFIVGASARGILNAVPGPWQRVVETPGPIPIDS